MPSYLSLQQLSESDRPLPCPTDWVALPASTRYVIRAGPMSYLLWHCRSCRNWHAKPWLKTEVAEAPIKEVQAWWCGDRFSWSQGPLELVLLAGQVFIWWGCGLCGQFHLNKFRLPEWYPESTPIVNEVHA